MPKTLSRTGKPKVVKPVKAVFRPKKLVIIHTGFAPFSTFFRSL
jgi:hypothetical protein